MAGITWVNQNQITTFVEDNGLTFPILSDTPTGGGIGQGVVYNQYYIPNQGSPYPRDFIVDREGVVRYANNEIDTEYMLAVLETLLDSSALAVELSIPVPDDFHLFPAYPNPFNPTTTISYQIPVVGAIHELPLRIHIYDITGRLVDTLVDEQIDPGTHEIRWHASNLPSGIYFANLIMNHNMQTKKLILLK